MHAVTFDRTIDTLTVLAVLDRETYNPDFLGIHSQFCENANHNMISPVKAFIHFLTLVKYKINFYTIDIEE